LLSIICHQLQNIYWKGQPTTRHWLLGSLTWNMGVVTFCFPKSHHWVTTQKKWLTTSHGFWGSIGSYFPIIWTAKLQSPVDLSTTEAEYIVLSMFLQGVLQLMFLIDKIRERNFQVICMTPHVYRKVFEDNSEALELARLPKLQPRTKHINVCYHHF
jgi:hypothetical protein